MRILVTGAGGYIGSVAAYLFLKSGYEVVALDNFTNGFRKPLELLEDKFPGKIKVIEADTGDNLNQVFEDKIDAVVHFAAFASVNESMEDPVKYFSNNVCSSQNLLATMLKNGVKNLVFSSTCATYGEAKVVPIDETHPTNPNTPYGHSKRMVEEIIEWYGKLIGLNYVILRYFNVCGASDDGLIGDSKKPSPHLMQNVVRGALGIEDFNLTCSEVDTPDKSPIRDYVNVVDLAQAHIKAVDYLLEGGSSEIINVGTGTGNSVLEIVKKVENLTGKKIEIKSGKKRKGEVPKLIASIKKAKSVLEWEPKRNLEDSVNSMLAWYKNHPNGWED